MHHAPGPGFNPGREESPQLSSEHIKFTITPSSQKPSVHSLKTIPFYIFTNLKYSLTLYTFTCVFIFYGCLAEKHQNRECLFCQTRMLNTYIRKTKLTNLGLRFHLFGEDRLLGISRNWLTLQHYPFSKLHIEY